MKKVLISLLVIVVIVIAAIGVAIMTFDVNKHRGQIEAALSKEIGRTVKLGGDIHIGVSKKGLTLAMQDVAFSNPNWASRPNMMSIKLFDLKVDVLALLSHKLDISGLAIEDADILLESASGNRHNWDSEIASKKTVAKETSKVTAAEPVALQITNMSIKNSRIAMRGEDGKVTLFKADEVTLKNDGDGTSLHFDGSFNDLAFSLNASSDNQSLLTTTARPIDLDVSFANFHIAAKGKVDTGRKRLDLDSYEIASGATILTGHLAAGWGGARPAIQGIVTSQMLEMNDLKMVSADKTDAASPVAEKTDPRMFSATPIDFAGLKAVDVNLDISIADIPAGSVQLHNLKSKLVVKDGHLFLSPFTVSLGDGEIAGQINLDAGEAPAKLGSTFMVTDVDLTDIIKAGGAEAFLAGKVKADVNLASSGNSMHELASNLSGPINLISAGGDVLTTVNDKISSGLAEILSPGIGNKHDNMNCLVARFIALNGVVKGNGILIDTMAATAAGYGDIDLRSETINLNFHTKPKLVDVGGLLPPLRISGTLSSPSVSADGSSLVQNVGSLLTGGTVTDGVPNVMTQQGQNACAYALDHPTTAAAKATASDKGGVVQDLAGQAGNLLKGFLGK